MRSQCKKAPLPSSAKSASALIVWATPMRTCEGACADGSYLRSMHRRVLLLRLCQAVLPCLGLAFHACALRADRARAAQQATRPQLVLLIATTIVYRCDPSGFSCNLTTRLPPCLTMPSPALRSDRLSCASRHSAEWIQPCTHHRIGGSVICHPQVAYDAGVI